MNCQGWDNYFTDRDQVVREIKESGLMMIEVDLTPYPVDQEPHVHDYEAHFYIFEGAIELHDLDTGIVHKHGVGSKVSMPHGVLHCGAHGGYRGLISSDVDLSKLKRRES